MRGSKRELILDTAHDIVSREGVRSLTYETLGQATGLSKAGLIYHFPSRESLLLAMQERLSDRWTAQMKASIGEQNPADVTATDRLTAYVRSATETSTPTELLLLLEAADDERLSAPGRLALEQWAPPIPTLDDPVDVVDAFLSRMAADGIWLYETLAGQALAPQIRARLIDRILTAAQPTDPGRDHPN